MKIDLTEIKRFFDPHQGIDGTGIPLPKQFKEAMDKLNGQKLSLAEAMLHFQSVIEKLSAKDSCIVQIKDGWISLTLDTHGGYKKGGRTYVWSLIKFE